MNIGDMISGRPDWMSCLRKKAWIDVLCDWLLRSSGWCDKWRIIWCRRGAECSSRQLHEEVGGDSEIHLIHVVWRQKRPVFEVTVVREINCGFGLCSGVVKGWNGFWIFFVGGASDEAQVEIRTTWCNQRSSLREPRLIILISKTRNTVETFVTIKRRPAVLQRLICM